MAGLSNKRNARDLFLGILLGASISVPILSGQGYFSPIPYSYVELLDIGYNEDNIRVEATFVKTDQCEFVDIGVFGLKLGRWVNLDWSDPGGNNGDRIEGYHTLLIDIDAIASDYTNIEIRTRHLCDGVKHDGVFLSIDINGAE